jgi:peroxiredoxin
LLVLVGGGCAAVGGGQGGPGAGVSAVVLTPDGKPAAGAQAALVPTGHWVYVVDGRTFQIFSATNIQKADPDIQLASAGADGQIHLPGVKGNYLLVVFHPGGYAQLERSAVERGGPVRLGAWAQVQGKMMIGKRPGNGINIEVFDDEQWYDPDRPCVHTWSAATTGADGTFVFDRVRPGDVVVGRRIDNMVQQQAVRAAPGQTFSVTIGGTGRAIVGRLKLPAELAERKDLDITGGVIERQSPSDVPFPAEVRNAAASIREEWYAQFIQTDAGRAFLAQDDNRLINRYPLEMAADGSFRAEDVPAGTYDVWFGVVPRGKSQIASYSLANGEVACVVPAMPGGRSDEPLDVGEVPLAAVVHPHVPEAGRLAPEFDVPLLDGRGRVKLSDFRGKYVLLEFWATWCGPCVGRAADLRDLQQRLGGTGRLAIISLSIDDQPYKPQVFVDQHHLNWTQGFIGADSQTGKDYDAEEMGYPSTWIIGPDGTMVRPASMHENIDRQWNEITATLTDALKR